MNNSLLSEALALIGLIVVLVVVYRAFVTVVGGLLSALLTPYPKRLTVEVGTLESEDVLSGYPKIDPKRIGTPSDKVPMFDPATLDYFGEIDVMDEAAVNAIVARAKVAQETWKKSSFATRKLLMRTMQRFFTENIETIARVSVRDSGKTVLDAIIGEVLVTCEKLTWLCSEGEAALAREYRSTGTMMMMKQVYVDYTPVGVIGAIVPWNYPFHNLFNPISAALFSGNAIVIKVSEYASWSIGYYKRVVDACLEAVGAPKDLVQIVVGYGATGAALVKSDVDKIIFVGSPGVGAIVAKAAADNLKPVVLELGGKDPFVVCEDVDVSAIIQTAVRGVWQNMGQNCAGPERFFVYEGVYDEFCDGVTRVVKNMKTGPSLLDTSVDCGAICMGPRQMQHYQQLVDDAVIKGARVLAGGYIPSGDDPLASGCFYPPTILADIPENARIAQEEIFGPIMAIFKVSGNSDAEAVRMANNCEFALSSCAFSNNESRARALAAQLHAGMSSVNDLEGCTYMSQSLPFGGYKKSGYDRFAGPEGLRGLCNIRSVCQDRFSFIRNAIPGPMQYPATSVGHHFAAGLVRMFYSTSLLGKLQGLFAVIRHAGAKPKSA